MFFFPLLAEKKRVIHILFFITEKNSYIKFVDKSTN